ncbi:MAG: GGDEF domain-containing protein [Aliidiomarina sp.]|nr:GGDEF domain-containing protein [Aliidiomarina sp.]
MDIDYFKTVNDTRGHSAGDRVLEQMGNLLKSIFRPADHLVRWGGEEFLVIARHLPGDQAVQMAERVRQTVAEHVFEVEQDACVRLSCSIGYAPYPPLADAPQAVNWLRLVDLADTCLYTAKSNGRNQHVGIVPGASAMTIEELETMLSDPPRLTPVPGIEVVRSTG